MELNGQRPDRGPVLVNGATGGVGSFAIDMLAGLGYEVAAFTGKRDRDDYLCGLGASRILYRDETEMGTRPLEKAQWAGAVDNVGGEQLAWLTRTMQPEGNVASIGARRGIQAGDHGDALHPARSETSSASTASTSRGTGANGLWQRLASDLKPRCLDRIVTSEVALSGLPSAFGGYLEGTITGRAVVRIAG